MEPKLAVLMPVFNGGELFRSSLESCASSGLDASQYEIIVVDNCSTDGCTDGLPRQDNAGASIRVYRNAANLGRVGNWNRAVEIAEALGFRWITFLFAGDQWSPNGSLPHMLRAMEESGAVFGLTPYAMVESGGRTLRFAQRVSIPGQEMTLSSQAFLETMIRSGHLPLGPLQANLYALGCGARPVFDEARPVDTDVTSTLTFLSSAPGTVLILRDGFLRWRHHPNRFFMSIPMAEMMRLMPSNVEHAGHLCGVPVDRNQTGAVNGILALVWIVKFAPRRDWPRHLKQLVRYFSSRPEKPRIRTIIELILRRTFLHRSLVHFDGTVKP